MKFIFDKKKLPAILLVVMLLTGCAVATAVPTQADQPIGLAIVQADMLILYDCPSESCAATGVIGEGEAVYVMGQDVQGFTPIKFFGATYYALSSGLRK